MSRLTPQPEASSARAPLHRACPLGSAPAGLPGRGALLERRMPTARAREWPREIQRAPPPCSDTEMAGIPPGLSAYRLCLPASINRTGPTLLPGRFKGQTS